MRLYRTELYKLLRRKLFLVGEACMIGILLFFFLIKVSDESAVVKGINYEGYEAVQVNRRITEEYKGILTDEKARQIIEKYGFPKEVDEESKAFLDTNFLNQFVMTYLSDGYSNRYVDYKIATKLYPITDTQLGAVKELTGKEIILEYSNGWLTFKDFWDLGMILGSIVILFTISIVFSNESQTKMLPLIFTTKEGRQKDIFIKIAAAFTIAVGIWLEVLLLDFVLCGLVYGFDGLDCLAGITTMENSFISTESWRTMLSVRDSIKAAMVCSLSGVLLLCGITIWISAGFKSTFHTVVMSVLCWACPVLVWRLTIAIWNYIFGFGIVLAYIGSFLNLLVNASPFYLTVYRVTKSWLPLTITAITAAVLCTAAAYRKHKRQQDQG